MTPWLTYSAITLLIGLLFGLLLWRQNKQSAKRWLITKIKHNPDQKDVYIEALNQIDQQPTYSFKVTLFLLLVLIPAGLLLNEALFPPGDKQPPTSQQIPSMEQALAQLEQSLQENPNDLDGQLLYARAMMSTQNFEAAVKALSKANELDPNNANILTELAEAVAFKNNTGSFVGEPEDYIEQALNIDPTHQKALWLKGIIAFEKQQFAEAEQLWTTLIQNISDDKVKSTILKQINQARSQQNKTAITLSDSGNPSLSSDNNQSFPGYQVIVDAEDTIKNTRFPATARVFVSAKALSGPPMPVAAIDVAPPFKWPLSINLTDRHNLTPQRRLSDFQQVVMTARLSVSGDAGASDYVSGSQTMTSSQSAIKLKLSAQ
jgi:cytochrome c-type biogenesis protein CcmH